MNIEIILSFALYVTVLCIIALYAQKKHTSKDYLVLGNRSLNFWVTALSAQASDMSSWLFMAFPMSVYIVGCQALWTAVSLVVGMWASWHFIAPKLRIKTEELNCSTLSSFFAKSFSDSKGTLRILSALLSLFFITYYLSSGFISIGFLFESLFGIDYHKGICAAAVVMMFYTMIGGFVSVAWADLFQAIFLLVCIMLVPIYAYFSLPDGFHTIYLNAQAKKISLSLLPQSDTPWKDIFMPLFGWGLGYLGMPHIVTKFMGISHAKDLKKSKYVGISWQILALLSAAAVGFVGIGFFTTSLNVPELIFVEMVKTLMPPFIAGLILCGILAATISTMDSQLLVTASIITEDVYKGLILKNKQPQYEKAVFRLSVCFMTFLALFISFGKNRSIMDTVYYAWAGLGSTFSPLVIAALYFPKIKQQQALFAMATGGITAALWPTFNKLLIQYGLCGPIYSMIPGFFSSLGILYLSSKKNIKKNLLDY